MSEKPGITSSVNDTANLPTSDQKVFTAAFQVQIACD